MKIIKPSLKDVVSFITETHQIEKVEKVTQNAVQNTALRKDKNIWAHGHLLAFDYTLNKLLNSPDYPSRNPDFKDIQEMNSNIHWLKHITTLIQSPLIADKDRNYQLSKIGIWRPDLADNTFTPAPSPLLIPYIMFNWLKELTTIHNSIKTNLDNPYGITKEQMTQMRTFWEQQPLFFSTVQPFKYDNNRLGRFIENLICLGWNIPFKPYPRKTYEEFKTNLDEYQKTTLRSIISSANQLKSKLS